MSVPMGRRFGWAATLPLLCAAHCAASPVLVLVAPALALPDAGETALRAASALLALTLGWTGIRAHGTTAVAVPILAGIGVWGSALLARPAGVAEHALTAAGAVLLAGGLAWDATLRHRARCPSCGGTRAAVTQLTETGIEGEV